MVEKRPEIITSPIYLDWGEGSKPKERQTENFEMEESNRPVKEEKEEIYVDRKSVV